RSVLPLSTSTAPAAKAPDLSATSRLRGRLLGFGVSGLPHSWYLLATPTIPFVPSPRSTTNAASNARRLLRYVGSKRPGECAKRTSDTAPGASGHQLRSAWSEWQGSPARSPNRLRASAGDQRRSAHSRW